MSEVVIDLSEMADEIENAEELPVFEEDREVRVRIASVRIANNKSGNPYLMPLLEIVDEDEPYADFSTYIGLPVPSMDAKAKRLASLRFRNFCQCFGVDPRDALKPTEEIFKGLEGYAQLRVTESEQYGRGNDVKRFVID